MTAVRYRSTPHRVRNLAAGARLSFSFFFNPNFNVEVKPIELAGTELIHDGRGERWDQASVHGF